MRCFLIFSLDPIVLFLFKRKKQINQVRKSKDIAFPANKTVGLSNELRASINHFYDSLERISMDFLCKSCFWNAG